MDGSGSTYLQMGNPSRHRQPWKVEKQLGDCRAMLLACVAAQVWFRPARARGPGLAAAGLLAPLNS